MRKAVDFNRFFLYNRHQYAGSYPPSCFWGMLSAAKEFWPMYRIVKKQVLNPTVTRKTVPAPLIAKKMEQG